MALFIAPVSRANRFTTLIYRTIGSLVRIAPRPLRRFRLALFGFTLVEVVMALGIFSFSMVAIGGLFFVGIDANKGSSDQIQAANLASLLISTRRALPTTTITNFALPPLNVSTSPTGSYAMSVGNDGTIGGTPAYNLLYQVTAPTGTAPHLAQVHLTLWWPPASALAATNPDNRYELTTQVALP